MKLRVSTGRAEHEVRVERRDGLYRVEVDGRAREVDVRVVEEGVYSLLLGGRSYEVAVEREGPGRYIVRRGAVVQRVEVHEGAAAQAAAGRRRGSQAEPIVAVMPGKVVRVLVRPGDEVQAGQGLLVVEAMKMENEVTSPRAGKVTSVSVEPGQTVEAGAVLALVE